MNARTCLTLTALSGFLSVLLGAFGAHGLKDSGYLERKYAAEPAKSIAGHSVPAAYKYLADFETGVQYHMTHTLALGLCGILLRERRSVATSIAAWNFLFGTILFSGSLYVLVIGGPRWLGIPWGMVAPIGGTLLLIGWLSLTVGCVSIAQMNANTESAT